MTRVQKNRFDLMDPYSDIAETPEEVLGAMERYLARPCSVSRDNVGKCKGCGKDKDLRFGYCGPCAGIPTQPNRDD